MPLLLHKKVELDAEVGVWNIEEDEDFFLDHLHLHEVEVAQLNMIKGLRRLEWLAARYLLHFMTGRTVRAICLKDDFGKPYLVDSSYHISMSHTKNRAAIIAGPTSVGIDIQTKVSKIERIAHKFISDDEWSAFPQMSIENMHIFWGAKECLYKAYGRKNLNFKSNIIISPIHFDDSAGSFKGEIKVKQFCQKYDLMFEWMEEEICLVYASHSE